MTTNKASKPIKYCIFSSTAALVLITISIVPISRRAAYWNSCFDNTLRWINEKEKELINWDITAKQSLAVSFCNGAVYEPNLKIK